VGRKLQGTESANIVGRDLGDGQTQVRRYIRLTELLPEILDMVDEGIIAMRPAVELSYIPKLQQGLIWESMELEGCTPSYAQAIRMRKLSEEHKLTPEAIDAILMEQKPNQKERIVLRGERFSRLFPPDLPISKREDYVAAAMEHYARFRERQRSRDDAR
jgi:ParB family chromosome partitioning protein